MGHAAQAIADGAGDDWSTVRRSRHAQARRDEQDFNPPPVARSIGDDAGRGRAPIELEIEPEPAAAASRGPNRRVICQPNSRIVPIRPRPSVAAAPPARARRDAASCLAKPGATPIKTYPYAIPSVWRSPLRDGRAAF